jgi:hypothetical protein
MIGDRTAVLIGTAIGLFIAVSKLHTYFGG